MVRQHAAIVVFSVERAIGHVGVKIKIKSKVKSVGQECPTHTSIAERLAFVCDG